MTVQDELRNMSGSATMNKNLYRNTTRFRWPYLALAVLAAAGVAATPVAEASSVPITLTPFGTVGAGAGVNEYWAQVSSTWQGPSYNASESTDTELDGISSIADANAALQLTPGQSGYIQSVSGVYAGPINYANEMFNTDPNSQPQYGTGTLPPLFFFNATAATEIDYAGRMWGYLYVPRAGQYNFGVLADDGFTFTLSGANGNGESMSLDGLNPRTYTYFNQNLNLAAGLYQYDLMGYNRLQDGVVRLLMGSATGTWDPTMIPGGDFYTSVAAVPLPASLGLMGFGFAALLGVAVVTSRKSRQRTRTV